MDSARAVHAIRRLQGSASLGLIVFTFIVVAPPRSAQTGSIQVHVVDANAKEPLPGATVTLSNDQQLLRPTSVLTESKGMVG